MIWRVLFVGLLAGVLSGCADNAVNPGHDAMLGSENCRRYAAEQDVNHAGDKARSSDEKLAKFDRDYRACLHDNGIELKGAN